MTNDKERAGVSRRAILGTGMLAALAWPRRSMAGDTIRMPFEGGGRERTMITNYPGKGPMILQRTRPPLLETPFSVFDKQVFTPVDQFFVRWHWGDIPDQIDPATFRVRVCGHVGQTLAFTADDLMRRFKHVELAAVNQCVGNSRGFFEPRVTGAQWGNGAMGNALWRGVQLRHVLDAAGVKPGAVQVQFEGADRPPFADAPNLRKSLAIDHARDGEVMIAWAMNGRQLTRDHGFPLRLIVPGWYSTYWIKMLQSICVLDHADTGFWTRSAYRIPDNWPRAAMRPGDRNVQFVPISRMVPRSFVTNLDDGAHVQAGEALQVRGIAFGGDSGVKRVDVSTDDGATWMPTRLGADHGKYSFRRWSLRLRLPAGAHTLQVRCTNAAGLAQPAQANWNPGGFMRNVIESVSLQASS